VLLCGQRDQSGDKRERDKDAVPIRDQERENIHTGVSHLLFS
jgi:hypothetical protein